MIRRRPPLPTRAPAYARTALAPLAVVVPLAVAVLPPLSAPPAWAVEPDEMLDNPALEDRARDISKGLRCVVCQSENIDESNADLAKDMRVRVRELLTEGYSNDEVVDYMVDRYGDYVLMKPPFKATTLALWLGPALLLGLGAVGVVAYYRGRGAAIATPDGGPTAGTAPKASAYTALSEAERERLRQLLADDAADDDDAPDRDRASATTSPSPAPGKEMPS